MRLQPGCLVLTRRTSKALRAARVVVRKTNEVTTMTQTTQSPDIIYSAYSVQDGRKGQKSYWTRIGRLFPHEDGKGHDLLLNALPVNGRIVIRQEEPREQAE